MYVLVVANLAVEHVSVDLVVLEVLEHPALDGGEGAGLVGAGGIALGGVGILFWLALRGAGGAGGASSCLIFFGAALADSAGLSAGLFGGGGCFGCFGSNFTVVSVVAFADSVDALAGVSALGRCCNCSINFFGGGLRLAFSASFALCSSTIVGGPLTGLESDAGVAGTG